MMVSRKAVVDPVLVSALAFFAKHFPNVSPIIFLLGSIR
jgi:hypothetical protein